MNSLNQTKSHKEKAERFWHLHQRMGSFLIPNPWDIGTAKILANLGFEALSTTSAGLAFSLGRPDLSNKLLLDEVIENLRGIVSACNLPVNADLENGYSRTPEGVYNTILKAGDTGIVGASIEDASGFKNNPIYNFELSVERIRAAAEAKNSLGFPFLLTARCDNYIYGREDIQNTIKRLQAYQEAGADVLYAPDLKSYDEISSIIESVDLPINVMANVDFSLRELTKIGVKRISVGSLLIRSAFGEFVRCAEELKEKGTFTFSENAMPFKSLMEIFE